MWHSVSRRYRPEPEVGVFDAMPESELQKAKVLGCVVTSPPFNTFKNRGRIAVRYDRTSPSCLAFAAIATLKLRLTFGHET